MESLSKHRGEQITLATALAFATIRGIPPGFDALDIEVPSTTIEAITVAFGPRIKRILYYDASVPVWRDYSSQGTDRNTASLIDLSAMQTADRLYVGATLRHSGWSVDVVGTNAAGTASGVWEYPADTVWTTLSATQTGIRATAVFDQDGLVTWTVPANDLWIAQELKDVADEALAPPSNVMEHLFWTRMRPDAAITDTSVTIAELTALFNGTLNSLTLDNEGQAAMRIVSNPGARPAYRFILDTSRYGSIELVSASITSAANLNWLVLR